MGGGIAGGGADGGGLAGGGDPGDGATGGGNKGGGAEGGTAGGGAVGGGKEGGGSEGGGTQNAFVSEVCPASMKLRPPPVTATPCKNSENSKDEALTMSNAAAAPSCSAESDSGYLGLPLLRVPSISVPATWASSPPCCVYETDTSVTFSDVSAERYSLSTWSLCMRTASDRSLPLSSMSSTENFTSEGASSSTLPEAGSTKLSRKMGLASTSSLFMLMIPWTPPFDASTPLLEQLVHE